MSLDFETWLNEQAARTDPIGELARVLENPIMPPKSGRGKPDAHKTWVEIVIQTDKPGYIPVFNRAWQEYIMAQQDATHR